MRSTAVTSFRIRQWSTPPRSGTMAGKQLSCQSRANESRFVSHRPRHTAQLCRQHCVRQCCCVCRVHLRRERIEIEHTRLSSSLTRQWKSLGWSVHSFRAKHDAEAEGGLPRQCEFHVRVVLLSIVRCIDMCCVRHNVCRVNDDRARERDVKLRR